MNYLYYKLYQATLKSYLHDTAEFTACIFFGGLIGVNIFVICALLAKFKIMPFLFNSKEQAGFFGLGIITLSCFYYLSKKRYKVVVRKYSQENNAQRVNGNIVVALYVIISFLSIFAVAFFKPGQL